MLRHIKRGLRATIDTMRSAAGPRPLILIYHRIDTPEIDPWGLSVSPARFAEQIELLRRTREILTLQDFVRLHRSRKLPRKAVAITFDDGYANNFYNAAPILRSFDAPATFFIASGYLDRSEFWWDELQRLILSTNPLPPSFTLSIEGRPTRFEAASSQEPISPRWRVWDSPSRPEFKLMLDLWDRMRKLPAQSRDHVLQQLRGLISAGASGSTRDHRPMTQDEVASLSRHEMFEIGAHTVSHPALSAQAADIQRVEIEQSKAACEHLSGRPVVSFSYPFGDLSKQTIRLLREADMTSACATKSRAVHPWANPFVLPRFWMADWTAAQLAAKIQV